MRGKDNLMDIIKGYVEMNDIETTEAGDELSKFYS